MISSAGFHKCRQLSVLLFGRRSGDAGGNPIDASKNAIVSLLVEWLVRSEEWDV